jgi:hypothetical protein
MISHHQHHINEASHVELSTKQQPRLMNAETRSYCDAGSECGGTL